MNRIGSIAISLLAAVTLSACAGKSANINAFTEPSYAPGSIKSLAIFPVVNASLAPGEGQRINQSIGPRIVAKNPAIEIISPTEAISKLNDADLGKAWSDFLTTYTSAGIPDVKTLRKVGSTIHADGILQGSVLKVVQVDGVYGGNAGISIVTVQFSLFDTKTGKLLWQASSEGRSSTATTLEAAPPLGEAVGLATNKLVENLPAL